MLEDLRGYEYSYDGFHNGYVVLSSDDLEGLAKFITQSTKYKMVTDILDNAVLSTFNVFGMGNMIDLFYGSYVRLREPLMKHLPCFFSELNSEDSEEVITEDDEEKLGKIIDNYLARAKMDELAIDFGNDSKTFLQEAVDIIEGDETNYDYNFRDSEAEEFFALVQRFRKAGIIK